jgi:hypothetical protein
MRDPLDALGHYFWEIIGCWGAMMAVVFLWLGYRIIVGLRERAARRGTPSNS